MLELISLTSGYGGGTVLDQLSLTVGPSEALGVMGRNGVGKTTLLKTIMGLVPPRAGLMRFDGVEIGRRSLSLSPAWHRLCAAGREIFADLTVAQNLSLALRPGVSLEPAYAAFPALRQKADALGGSLSGGQQQQLAIARVLLAEPKLILLDEPSDGVQPSVVAEIGETLAALRGERPIAMILVEQDAELVLRLCDRVVVMEEGRIVAEHSAGALRADPALLETVLAL